MLRFSRRQGLRLMLGASQAVLLGAAGCVQRGYDATVAGIPGLVAYWRFSDASGVIDATAGGRHGTYDGTVSLVPGLPADSDAATHLPGNVVGTVPHDPGLLLPEFTLSFWVVLVEEPTDPNWYFINKDASGLVDGDFGVRFTPELELNARFQTTEEGSAPGATFQAQVGVPYHVVVTAGAHGLTMWVDGKLIDTDDTYQAGWSENTEPILFAGTQFNQLVANIILDEVALYSRALADSEIIALSQRTSPPVAAGDSFQLPGGTTAIIDILANDIWVGRPANVTIEIVSPSSFGAITVRNDKTIEFAAYPVEQTQAGSFAYRIQDANGQSNTATVNVTVQHVEAPPTSPAHQCYVESGADTVVVTSMAALETAINNAPPGRNILVAQGTYTGGTLTLNASGTAANPVVIRPQSGTVTINDANWTIVGTRLVISKLSFNNAGISLNNGASFTRVTRCQFRDIGRITIRPFACTDLRVDHCDFAEYRSSTAQKACLQARHTNVANGTCRGILFDYNHVHDITPEFGANGSELIGTSSSASGAVFQNIEFVISHCLLRNIGPIPASPDGGGGEGEIIGAKFSFGRVEFSTFENINGMYFNAPRGGQAWEIRSCWFNGNRNPTLMLRGVNGKVIGCRFFGSQRLQIEAGTATWQQVVNNGGHEPGWYTRCESALVVGNVLDTGEIRVGSFWNNNGNATVPAINTRLEANVRNGAPATTGNGIVLVGGNQTGTTIGATTTSAFDPAVKLGPGDVGLNAADPPCSLA